MGKIRREISLKNITQVGDVDAIKKSFNQHLHLSLMKDRNAATSHDYYSALAYAVRDKLVENWIKTQQCYYNEHPKVFTLFCVIVITVVNGSFVLACTFHLFVLCRL